MSRLEKTIRNISKAQGAGAAITAPSFNCRGRVMRPGLMKTLKRAAVASGIIICMLLFLYLPQAFMKDEGFTVNGDLGFLPSSVTLINDARSSDWSGDFDGDGLDNQEELNLLTDPYSIDTDGDNITDYAEIYVTKTSPITYNDTLLSNRELEDEMNGSSLGTPYKVGNVILWAADYRSKAYGSVVETPRGYRICGFSGYAQFPLYDGWFAYKVEGGIHKKLEYLDEAQVWKVSDGDTIELYPHELEEKVKFTVFGKEFLAGRNDITDFLSRLLPDRGFITAQPLTAADLERRPSEAVMAAIKDPEETAGSDRFRKNCTLLSDIMAVREAIDSGKCVYFTIYHENLGEKQGIIFGYYPDDNTLLAASPETLMYVGNISIKEKAEMMIIGSGETVSYEYFDFYGFGASSGSGFRINFYGVSD